MKSLPSLLALTFAAVAATAHAQVPQLLNYQGRVLVGGTNFEGTAQFKFALVGTNASGSIMTFWSNDGTGSAGNQPLAPTPIVVVKGLYSVLLGDATLPNMRPIPATIFTNADVRLRIWFTDGTTGFELLSPDNRIAAVGYALVASTVPDNAITMMKIAPNSVLTPHIFDGSITGAKLAPNAVATANIFRGSVTSDRIATGAVVKSVNSLKDDVVLAAGPNVVLTTNGNTLQISAASGGNSGAGWSLTGNSGMDPQMNFLGTTDRVPLELRANRMRGLELTYQKVSGVSLFTYREGINLLAGYWGNSIASGVLGGTVAGGGFHFSGGVLADYASTNQVTDDFGTVSGGAGNSAALYATVPGGRDNTAAGSYSFAAGRNAKADHSGVFVWADSQTTEFRSSANNQFLIRAAGGVGIGTDHPEAALHVAGIVKADGFDGPLQNVAIDGQDQNTTGTLRPGVVFGSGGTGEGISSKRSSGGNQWGLDFFTADQPRLSIANDGNLAINDHDLRLRGLGDSNHGLGYYGGTKTFAGNAVDGPVLYGFAGGALGTTSGGQKTALTWNTSGDVKVKVLVIEGGADLAEPFEMPADVPQGAVVVIDENNPGQLRMSDRAYDTRVAGVVSGAHGIHSGLTLQQKGKLEGSQNVALTGRVYVLADASEHPIRPGDLLTTSDVPGHAMKSIDPARAHGAILGKAMSGLKEGRGLILVLVNLQ